MSLVVKQANEVAIAKDVGKWLTQLAEPTVIELKVSSNLPWHIISVLVHGNEPSGLLAAHKFLLTGIKPSANLAFIISSIKAASTPPLFHHRFLPGQFDLNRRFGKSECSDPVTHLAHSITEYIRIRQPEAVIDLHNTSGRSPAFAVSISEHPQVQKLAALFSDDLIVTQLNVGALMEQNFNCPVVTIECGGADDSSSHELAWQGIKRFAGFASINSIPESSLQMYNEPLRVELHSKLSLDYGPCAQPHNDLTLVGDIEELNFNLTKKDRLIGWSKLPLHDLLSIKDPYGADHTTQFFEKTNDDEIRLVKDARFFMATRRADIALSDCVFYIV